MSKQALRSDYKPGRAQAKPARRGDGERGRGAAAKPLQKKPAPPPSPCSDSDCSCGSFETIESSASACSVHAVALAKLQEVAARVDARNAKAKTDADTEAFWMDSYWSEAVHRRAATVGEISIRRGPPEVDDGAIFEMDL